MKISHREIEAIFKRNIHQGIIETGFRIWVSDTYLDNGGNKQFKALVEKARSTEGAPSLAPIEKTRDELNTRISEIAEYLYKLQ